MPAEVLGLAPGGRISGEARVPGSKSLAQRALLCAGLGRGTTEIRGLPDGDDVAAALDLVEAAGAVVERGKSLALVRSEGAWSARKPVSVGESGTLARIATAAFALVPPPGRTTEIRAAGTLHARTSAPLFRALERAGAAFEALGEPGGWPVRVTAVAPPAELVLDDPVSSQEVSALLLAGAAGGAETRVSVRGDLPSRPYVRMTERLLERFGVSVGPGFVVRGPLVPPAGPLAIEPDASSAAVLLAAACLSGGAISVPGLGPDSIQGDVRIIEHLSRFGCRASADVRGLHAEGRPSRGADLDLSGEPDLAPVLAAVAAGAALRAGATSRLAGLETLRRKESDRIAVLARGLDAIGLEVRIEPAGLVIGPGRWRGGRGDRVLLDPRGDHRMAFAFALLGLLGEGVAVADATCVAKSWPSFWTDVAALGAVLQGAPA